MTDDRRNRNRSRTRRQSKYTYLRILPTVFKVMAHLTLLYGTITVLVPLLMISKVGMNRFPFRGAGQGVILVPMLFTVLACIVGFLMFMGLSQWAKVAMETHLNVLLAGQHLREARAPGQQPQEPEQEAEQ